MMYHIFILMTFNDIIHFFFMFVGRSQELPSPAEMHSDGSRPHPTLGRFPAHERGGNNRLRSLRTLGKFPVFSAFAKKNKL